MLRAIRRTDLRLARRPHGGAIAITAMAAAITLASLTHPRWLFLDNPTILASTDTVAGMAALAATWFALLRAERTSSASDLALVVAIGSLSLTSMLLGALTLIAPVASSASAAWLAVPGRLATGALLLAAGRSGHSVVRLPGRLSLVLLITGFVSVLACCGAILGALTAARQVPIWIELAAISLYLAAALTLRRRAQRAEDPVLSWYAAAALALAASRLTFTLLPAPASHWFSPGDVVRLAVAALLLMAVRADLIGRRGRVVETAIAKERRRLAQEIHDGLAQELAFIASQTRRLTKRPPDAEVLALLASAGQTALADARRAIFDLKRPSTPALSAAIVEKTFPIADRAGLTLDVEVHGEAAVGPEVEHAILRIVNEAVSNAAHHAGASTVSIRVSCHDNRAVVRITDDGTGFDPDVVNPRRGFGLRTMTERAESLGGTLRLESAPGAGTTIEVAL